VTTDGVCVGCLDIMHLFTQLVTTSNSALSLMYALYSSPLHTHTTILNLRQSYPGNGFQHSNYISIAVTAAHMRSSFPDRILATQLTRCHLFSMIFDCRLRRLPQLFFSKSQSHMATDGQSIGPSVSQSVSQSWCRAPSGTYDQIFITV
jgi:hypothetical protein